MEKLLLPDDYGPPPRSLYFFVGFCLGMAVGVLAMTWVGG